MVANVAAQSMKRVAGTAGAGGFRTLQRNIRTLVGDYGHVLMQDHAALKANALIASTLILVLSRIGISYGSAQNAKGTPEEQYRRQEFIRTAIRELCGWTLSFIAFRFFEHSVKRFIRSKMFLDLGKGEKGRFVKLVGSIKNQMGAWIKGTIKPIKKNRGPFVGHQQEFVMRDPSKYTGVRKWLVELFSSHNKKSAREAKIEQFYDWFPIVVGSIPAIALSGYYLERFSIDRSQVVVEAFNNWISKRKQKHAPRMAGAQNPFYVPATPQQKDFSNFLSSVHEKQVKRV